MDQFIEMNLAMEAYINVCDAESEAMEVAITPSGRKYKKLLKGKRVEQILSEFFKAIGNEGVQIDRSGTAGEKLGKLAKRRSSPTYTQSQNASIYIAGEKITNTTVDGVPVAIRGTSEYIDRIFWFCIKKNNGKSKVVKITINTIAKVYNDDLSKIEPERVRTYVKKLMKYANEASDNADTAV